MSDRDPKNTGRTDAVVLLHGLGGKDWNLRYLGRRFDRSGLAVRYHHYPSRTGNLEEIARGLAETVTRTEGRKVHLLGHSLGGIVIAKMLETTPPANVGRVAFLGCPIGGSAAITALSGNRFGRRLLGPVAREGIVERRPRAPVDRELLVVAGTLPMGIGLLTGLPRPHDGWVQVSETRIEGARLVTSRAFHFGLLFSRNVADLLCAFFSGEI
ncbi:MAG: esterase/lipase family protein [Candidatus Deferrimicrobiaceae bacterium]